MRSAKFWVFALLCVLTWVAIEWSVFVSEGSLDTFIAAEVGSVLIASSAGMAIVRRDWTARALGVFGVFLGAGIFFLEIWGQRVDTLVITREWLNPVRAVLLVGGNAFAIGFVRWAASFGVKEHEL